MKPTPIQRLGLLSFGALLLALFAGFAIAQGIGPPAIPGGDVALVEDVPQGEITQAQFRRALIQAAGQGGLAAVPKPAEEGYAELSEAALGGLLAAAWVRGEAGEAGIEVSSDQVAAALAEIKKKSFQAPGAYADFLRTSHYTQEEVNQRIALQLLTAKLQEAAANAAPAPSESQVHDYYEAAKALQFTLPARYDVRLILNKDKAKAQKSHASLQADDSLANWKALARRYSEDPAGKASGGLHRGIPAEFGEPLDRAIEAAPLGELRGLVKINGVFFVFRVERETPPKVEPLAKVRSHILAQLEKQNREEAVEAFAYSYEGKWLSRTHCAPGYVIDRCDNYPGSGRPLNAPEACYQAHPKAGIAAPSCPAPVAQLVPAAPGTVSILRPKGIALPQRPHPEP